MSNLKKRFSDKRLAFNGLYVHYSAPRAVALHASSIKQWTRNGDIDKLEQLVFDGQGQRLKGELTLDPRVNTFLKAVPNIMDKCGALHEAVMNGSLAELQELLKNDPLRRKYALCKDAAGVGLLHKAVYFDFVDIVSWLTATYPQTVHQKDSEGRTPLHYACMCRDPSAVAALLTRAGAERGVRDAARRLPAQYARGGLTLPSAPDADVARTASVATSNMPTTARNNYDGLVIKPSNIRIWCHDRNLGRLQRVVWEGQGARLRTEVSSQPTVKKFLEAVPYIMNTVKEIHTAVLNNDIDGVKALTADPIPPIILSSKDANGLNVLHKAAGLGYVDIVELVARACPSALSASDVMGRTPLHYAASFKGDRSAYDALLQHDVEEGKLDIKMKTAGYYLNRPNEIDRTLLMVIPDAPRVPANTYPSTWDWSLLEANNNSENQTKKSRRKNGSIENILSDSNKTNSMIDLTSTEIGNKIVNSLTNDSLNGIQEINSPENEDQTENKILEENMINENEAFEFIPITELNGISQDDTEKHDKTIEDENKEEVTKDEEINEEETKDEDSKEEETQEDVIDNAIDLVNENDEKQYEDDFEQNGEKNIDDPSEDEKIKEADSEESNEDQSPNDLNDNLSAQISEGDIYEDNQVENDIETNTTEPEDNSPKENIIEGVIKNEDETENEDGDKESFTENTNGTSDGLDNQENEDKIGDDGDDDDVMHGENDSQDGDITHQSTAELKDIESPIHEDHKEGNDGNPDPGAIENGEYNKNEIADGDVADDPEVFQYINNGNMEQLAALVLNGEGNRLTGKRSDNAELQAFLDNVPNYMNKIKRVHIAAKEGKIRDLQAALDRRKFAIARDPVSANGATPLHVATVFGHSNIMQYLGGRFPETLSAVDFEGRTALHYAATIPDNGHFYNLLQNFGANGKDLDDEGRSAEMYLKDDSFLTFQQLADDFGIAKETVAEMFKDKVPNDQVSSRRDLTDPDLLSTLERCYTLLQESRRSSTNGVPPSASSNQGSPATFLGRFLRRPNFDKVKLRITKLNHNLFDVIWPTVKRLPENKYVIQTVEEDFIGGVVAPDYNVYPVFKEFLIPLVKDLHCMKVTADIQIHPKSNFLPKDTTHIPDEDDRFMDLEMNVDESNKYILSGMIECSRNLDGFELPLNLGVGQLKIVERTFTSILMSKDFTKVSGSESNESEDSVGVYYTLNEILEKPSEIRAGLAASGLLIPLCDNSDIEDDERFYGRHWPYGRGVYVSSDYELAAWINIQDHFRLVLSTPRDNPGEIGKPYTKLAKIMMMLHRNLKFKWDNYLGHLSSRPLFLGNSLHFNLILHLPSLSKEPEALKNLFTVRGLHCRETMSTDIVRAGNYQSIGVTEIQTFEDFATAISNVIHLEEDIAMQSSVHITDMLMNIFRKKRSSIVDSG